MTYKEFVDNILATRGRFNVDGYKERHHIKPRCLGGEDTEDNLIDLTAKEHYIAHKLLVEENPGNNSLFFALYKMVFQASDNQQRIKLSEDEYDLLKRQLSEIQKVAMAGENNPMYGKNAYEGKTAEEMSVIKEKKQASWQAKSDAERAEHKMKIRLNIKTRQNVLCVETNTVYPSIRYAEKVSGAHRDDIAECCKGLREVDYKLKYHWQYV